ncbi:MAG: ABC transporter ATP-binding protein [Ancalomicrobiaceae bacterium]|nr:ABC transporter ATP-binding protein [Ancalomicrobiaceae bacterium]
MAGILSRILGSNEELHLLSRLINDHGRRHVALYLLATFFLVLVATSTSLTAYIMSDVIDQVFIGHNWGAVVFVSIAILVIFLVKGGSTYGQQVTLSYVANAIVAAVQRRLYAHTLDMDVPYFADRHTAEFIGQTNFASGSAAAALNTIITSVGRDALSLVGLVAVMVLKDPVLSVFGLIIVPPAIIGVQRLVLRAKKVMKTEFLQGLVVMEVTQETVQGIQTVKAYTLEKLLTDKMHAAIASVQAASNKLARVGARSSPLMETLGGLAIAAMVFYGGWRVNEWHSSPGAFFSFITALLLAYEPAKRLAQTNVNLAAQMVGVKILYSYLDTPGREAADDRPALKIDGGRVEFDTVCFAYRPGEEVLKSISFVAEAGKTTALVGPSGAGKSTILSLLLRFWDIETGAIRIDGSDIRSVSRQSLRSQIAYVSQSAILFKGTVLDNIALGRPGASEEEIITAAKAAYAHDFIIGFEDGYRSQVGENGLKLSGGQRQRIAIARAILKDAPILVLDEATAALDAESERAIQSALEVLSANRTTIVIAHRLQTIQRADKICFMEHGHIIEQGSHDDLRAQAGRYAAMYQLHVA